MQEEDIGDYDTMEIHAFGGREAVTEELEEEAEYQQEIEQQEDMIKSLERFEASHVEWTTNPALGDDDGRNANGAALRVYDGRRFRVRSKDPPSARTHRQEIMAKACLVVATNGSLPTPHTVSSGAASAVHRTAAVSEPLLGDGSPT